MRVIKVLNNSLVLALNDEGQEIILMGKGIGFQKTIGYKLSSKEIDKVFVLKDRELSRRIIRLAAETDSIYFEMAKSVIDYAVENYHMKLMDHMLIMKQSASHSILISGGKHYEHSYQHQHVHRCFQFCSRSQLGTIPLSEHRYIHQKVRPVRAAL